MSRSGGFDCVVAALEAHGSQVRNGKARCPAHEDSTASLTINASPEGHALVCCHAGCAAETVVAALGLEMGDLFADAPADGNGSRPIQTRYAYQDPRGRTVVTVVVSRGNGGKKIWREPKGVPANAVPPYRLPELRQAIAERKPIFVVEGEKCVDAIVRAGRVGTTNAGGAGKWLPEHSEAMARAASVTIVADADGPGVAHARAVATSLREAGVAKVGMKIPRHRPDDSSGYDIADQLAAGHDLDDLDDLDDLADPAPGGEAPPASLPTLGFEDVTTRRVEWLWKGRIPYGKVTLFDGAPGQSKSTVALDIAARITRGFAMPDGAKPERGAGGVLIVSAEDAIDDTIGPRLIAAGVDRSRVRFFKIARDDQGVLVPLTIPDDLRRLAHTIEEHGLHLVVVDPLVAFLSERTDSHNDASIRRALGPLTVMAEETNVAVVAIRHLTKALGMSAIDRGGGSVGIGANARSVLIFAAHPDEEEHPDLRVMASAKGNLSARPATLGYRVDEEPIQLDDGYVVGHPVIVWQRDPVELSADQLVGFRMDGRKESPDRDVAADWLREVLADGPMPAKEVFEQADDAGHSQRTIERAKEGVARSERERNDDGSTGRWMWRLLDHDAEEGEEG